MTFGIHLARWDLVADGEPITTPSSFLLPVRHNGGPAMLKIAREEEERRGGTVMAWWNGDGVARVLAQHGPALLLERANGPRSLTAMVAAGQDDEASCILCEVASRLHAPRGGSLPDLVPLVRADASEVTFRNENLFYEFQSRVDNVAGLYGLGHHAPKPMAGEVVRAYKVRCLRPWQSLSQAFKDVDLKILSIADGAAFAVACDDILKAADSEARHPTKVPDGWLTERTERRGGHTYTCFYGRPRSWMSQFAPRGAVVKNVRQVAPDGRIEGTLYQRG